MGWVNVFCFTSFMLLPCFGCRVFLPFFCDLTFGRESIMTLQNLAKFDTLVRSSDEKRECIVRVLWFLSCFFLDICYPFLIESRAYIYIVEFITNCV